MRLCNLRWCGFFCLLLMLPLSLLADADLSLSSRVTPSPVVVNGTTYLTVSLSNLGDEVAQDVIVSATLAAGLNLVAATTTQGSCSAGTAVTCNLGEISSGVFSVQATVTLEVTVSSVGGLNAEFTVSSSTLDANPANDSSSITAYSVALNDSADLGVAYNYSSESRVVDGLWSTFSVVDSYVSYPLQVVNNGPSNVSDVVVEFNIPSHFLSSFNSATSTQGSCTTALSNCVGIGCLNALGQPIRVSCDLGLLTSGAVANIDVMANTGGPAGYVFNTNASVSSDTIADADYDNNSRGSSVTLIEPDYTCVGECGYTVPEYSCEGECGGSIGIGCFIASAAFGSDMEREVMILREFRDKKLLPYDWGRKFVNAYYRHSPPFARFIQQHDSLRAIVRWMLYVPVTMIQFPVASLLTVVLILLVVFKRIWRRAQG